MHVSVNPSARILARRGRTGHGHGESNASVLEKDAVRAETRLPADPGPAGFLEARPRGPRDGAPRGARERGDDDALPRRLRARRAVPARSPGLLPRARGAGARQARPLRAAVREE